jgi:hypothetical protein
MNITLTLLTRLQSFYAMQLFFENYFKETSSDSLGSLLSCMLFLEEGGQTADPALWEDWIDCLKGNEFTTPIQAFIAVRLFLENYYKNSSSSTIKKILEDTKVSVVDQVPIDQETWNRWLKCIENAISEKKKNNILILS